MSLEYEPSSEPLHISAKVCSRPFFASFCLLSPDSVDVFVVPDSRPTAALLAGVGRANANSDQEPVQGYLAHKKQRPPSTLP